MASLTPRASGFWATQEDLDDESDDMGATSKHNRRSGHEDDDDDGYFGGLDGDLEQQERLLEGEGVYDGRTPVSTAMFLLERRMLLSSLPNYSLLTCYVPSP
jgi:hypothetical protein